MPHPLVKIFTQLWPDRTIITAWASRKAPITLKSIVSEMLNTPRSLALFLHLNKVQLFAQIYRLLRLNTTRLEEECV